MNISEWLQGTELLFIATGGILMWMGNILVDYVKSKGVGMTNKEHIVRLEEDVATLKEKQEGSPGTKEMKTLEEKINTCVTDIAVMKTQLEAILYELRRKED